MKSVFLFGECMVELQRVTATSLRQSFAGDVYNTGVYLKRTFSDINTHLVTAIGQDSFSQAMLQSFADEAINTDMVFKSPDKIAGLYAIQTDSRGERSFTYWRSDSAARQVMQFIDDAAISKITQADMVFFSGISLAVIKPEDRDTFWQLIKQCKQAGVSIVFDPNYRARMWQNPQQAKVQFDIAFGLADVALPGVDDFDQLYGINTVDEIIAFCQPYAINELVIKNGENGINYVINDQQQHFSITPVTNVVDTTSAGDSFNGVYLGARLSGLDINTAIKLASHAAGFVIQHKGAIAPKIEFNQFIERQKSMIK
ncbi:sugar kinase [Shewanella sp. H8]|uniref:sugar kinase n=1 Tax=Shewanella sp. H8 TaxID=3342676 RepID=UPI0033150664